MTVERAAGLGYRAHASGKRRPRGMLRYTDGEWAAIVRAATARRMRPGAWAQHVAHLAAIGSHRDGVVSDRQLVEALLVELRQHRRVLTNIGGNLNDVARVANSTGGVDNPVAAAIVLRLVRRVVHRSDELLDRVRVELLP